MKDQAILEQLGQNDSIDKEPVFRYLYKAYYAMIEQYVLKNNGTDEDAKDIFQDTLICFYSNVKQGTYKHQAKISTYLFAVAKNLWLKKLRREKRALSYIDEQVKEETCTSANALLALEFSDRQVVLANLLKQAGDKCLQLLKSFYFEKMTMLEIANRMGLASKDVAKNQKSRCLKKLKLIVRSNPYYTEHL